MNLELKKLPQLNTELPDYEMVCACSHAHDTAVLWKKKLLDGYQYLLKKYDCNFEEIASCTFQKKLSYDVIRMYRNICVLVNFAGGFEKGRFIKNALFITPQGNELKEFPVGMGLNAISISPQGTLWCGYDNNGSYQEFVPNISKGHSCILAAWNFFGELIYEFNCPTYDSKFGFFHDCYSIYAKNNDEIYFFYYDKFDLCQIHNFEEKNLFTFSEEHGRPFNFTIKDNFIWIHFEPFIENLKSLQCYQIYQQKLIHKEDIHLQIDGKEIKDYRLFFNEDIILIQHHSQLYLYQI